MNLSHKILILLFGVAISLQAVPPVLNYAGQVAVNGEAFDGNGLFKFALVNADGTTTYWSNDGTSVEGSEPQASVAVPVNGGLYSILLGNTGQQGMGAIDPAVFAQHTDAKLRVWFSDGVNGFQQLSPDRPFASVPFAFNSKSADTAKTADSANIAMAVQAGAVTSSMLASNAVTSDKLSPQIKADINATIGMNRLSTEVTEKLNQEKTTTNYNAPSVGSLLAVPSGSDAPGGYSLYQQGEPKELVWEEKAPVSVARFAFDGVEVLDGKIYFVGGSDGSAKNIAERYDPETNTWETLNSLSQPRDGVATAVMDGKLYAIGGAGLSSVEIYDPSEGTWSTGIALPHVVRHGNAIAANGKIYLFGGRNDNNDDLNTVYEFDPVLNYWSSKSNMPIYMEALQTVLFQDRIWIISGRNGNTTLSAVLSYDIVKDNWQEEKSLNVPRFWPTTWVYRNEIYLAGGKLNGTVFSNSINYFEQTTSRWLSLGNLPENKFGSSSVILNEKVYIIAGHNGSGYSNKVFAADLNASMEGVYDLYRKDGDAPVGTPVVQSEYADGSVTGSKMADGAVTASKIASNAITTNELSEQILKYLKPEITSQPQAQTVYADTNVSYSVIAEGKYLTYQWKKDGVDLVGETNATLNITDANATLHDGNYSVVVSNDFGSVESGAFELIVSDPLLKGLVGWWKFDEGSGTVAYDSSGNGNDGNLTNGPTWTTGKIGGALSFDGVDDSVLIPATSDLDLQTLSIFAWVNSSNYIQDGFIFEKTTNGISNTQYNLFLWNNNKIYWRTKRPDAGFNEGDLHTATNLSSWSLVSVTYDGASKKIYINSDMVASMSWSSLVETNPNGISRIGAYSNSPGDSDYCFNGLIDDVRIYDRALSAAEVQALYNMGQ